MIRGALCGQFTFVHYHRFVTNFPKAISATVSKHGHSRGNQRPGLLYTRLIKSVTFVIYNRSGLQM